MTWYWLVVLALVFFPFTVKEQGGYLGGLNAAFALVFCWGAAIAMTVGILIGRFA